MYTLLSPIDYFDIALILIGIVYIFIYPTIR